MEIPDLKQLSLSADKPDTLYPKITGNFQDYVKVLEYRLLENQIGSKTSSIPLTGTVKLHGIHADIVINANDTFRIQSRNQHELKVPGTDLHGLASHLLPLHEQLIALKSKIEARFRDRNPEIEIDRRHPLIIAGEWIGPDVQKKVAISRLPKRLFVIISINVNNSWQPDEPYGDIHDEQHSIYHISRGGFFHHELQIDGMLVSLQSLQPLADTVESECPFARTFGISGRGEGIVWKPTSPLGGNAKYWFKMKGPISKARPVSEKKFAKGEEMQQATAFAEEVVGEMRLEQGWQYMVEMGLERDRRGVESYLKWLRGDVEVEEKDEIVRRRVDQGLLKKAIDAIGRQWYLTQVEKVDLAR